MITVFSIIIVINLVIVVWVYHKTLDREYK